MSRCRILILIKNAGECWNMIHELRCQKRNFQAVLPEQFDEYIWFDQTRAITPFDTKTLEDLPDTYPFGL